LVNVIHSGCSGPLRNLEELRIWEYPLYVEIPRSGDQPECIAMRHGLQFQVEGQKIETFPKNVAYTFKDR